MTWENLREKINTVLQHAVLNSRFYREKYRALDLSQIGSETDFKKLPILEKKELLKAGKEVLTIGLEDVSTEKTSGTTGDSLTCYKSVHEKLLKGRDVWGIRFTRGHITPTSKVANFFLYFTDKEFISDRIYIRNNNLYLSTLDMSPASMNEYIKAISEFKAEWMIITPSALCMLIQQFIDNNWQMNCLSSIRYIECIGERLQPYQREISERVFGKIVHSVYGTTEHWWLAVSCEHNNMHIIEDRFYFEVINVDNEGTGELVVTDLTNKAWPLIRYRLGDLVSQKLFKQCDCGMRSPVIDLQGGRSQEYVVIGEWVAAPMVFHYPITYLNKMYGDCVRSFRVIQTEEDRFCIRLVTGTTYNELNRTYLEDYWREKLPNHVSIEVELVERLEFLKRKFNYFIPYQKKLVEYECN